MVLVAVVEPPTKKSKSGLAVAVAVAVAGRQYGYDEYGLCFN